MDGVDQNHVDGVDLCGFFVDFLEYFLFLPSLSLLLYVHDLSCHSKTVCSS